MEDLRPSYASVAALHFGQIRAARALARGASAIERHLPVRAFDAESEAGRRRLGVRGPVGRPAARARVRHGLARHVAHAIVAIPLDVASCSQRVHRLHLRHRPESHVRPTANARTMRGLPSGVIVPLLRVVVGDDLGRRVVSHPRETSDVLRAEAARAHFRPPLPNGHSCCSYSNPNPLTRTRGCNRHGTPQAGCTGSLTFDHPVMGPRNMDPGSRRT